MYLVGDVFVLEMYIFSLSLSWVFMFLCFYSIVYIFFFLVYSCFTNLMVIDTLIILIRYLVLDWFCEIRFKLCFTLYFPHMHLWFVFNIPGIYRLILSWCCCLLLQLVDSKLWLDCSRATTCIGLVLELSNSCLCMFCHRLPKEKIVRF